MTNSAPKSIPATPTSTTKRCLSPSRSFPKRMTKRTKQEPKARQMIRSSAQFVSGDGSSEGSYTTAPMRHLTHRLIVGSTPRSQPVEKHQHQGSFGPKIPSKFFGRLASRAAALQPSDTDPWKSVTTPSDPAPRCLCSSPKHPC